MGSEYQGIGMLPASDLSDMKRLVHDYPSLLRVSADKSPVAKLERGAELHELTDYPPFTIHLNATPGFPAEDLTYVHAKVLTGPATGKTGWVATKALVKSA